jgi:AAA family ATP:ADP antiporter
MIPGFLAVEMGSEILLLGSLATCISFIICYKRALQSSQATLSQEILQKGGQPSTSMGAAIGIIGRSRLLPYILLIVVFMQVTATLIDYQFNHFLQEAYPQKNIRTEFLGKLGGVISTGTMTIQFVGSFLFLQFLGLRRSHFVMPLVFMCNTMISLLFPGIRTMTYSFATMKVLDFSLFSVVKEMLYLPLSTEEKFQAKAVIDVFVYRASKAFAAMLILGLQWVRFSDLQCISWAMLILFMRWAVALVFLFRAYPKEQMV